MHKYEESKTARIMMATVRHVTSSLGLRKFQADGFLFDRVYIIIVSLMQPKLHNVNTNAKLRVHCNVDTKCSPVKFGKNPNIEKKYTLICMEFWLGQQKLT